MENKGKELRQMAENKEEQKIEENKEDEVIELKRQQKLKNTIRRAGRQT